MSNEEIKQLEAVATARKPKRVKNFKEDYVRDLTIARMELHAVKCTNERLNSLLFKEPTIIEAVRLLVKAVVRKVRGV